MCQGKMFCLFLLIWVAINAQTINVRGKVLNKTGAPISSAIVTLARQGLKDTTGTDGAYSISKVTAVELPALPPQSERISLNGGVLELSLVHPSAVKVEILTVKGDLLKNDLSQNVAAGVYRLDIAKSTRATNLLIVKASIGKRVMSFRYIPLNNASFTVDISGESPSPVGGALAKMAAVVDTVRAAAANYSTKSVAITSYDQELNISLDTAGQGARPSLGCGKATTLKGEQRLTISVDGKNREYIIRLPDDYDANTPYRLWFSIHCLGGTAKGVADANGYEYYGIWKFANPSGGKGTTIFCSPEGTAYSGSSLGWGNSGGSDVQLIRALIQKFESELCIDQSRIFSEGFSMGGSMSYALACAMPDTFRAVCMHSGGVMSGCDGAHRGPVPIFITHGTKDQVLAYPGSGVPQIKDLAQRDSCTAIDIASVCKPTDESGMTPVCVDYKGCKPGYPCKACIFVGQHDPSPGGQAKTWVDDSTWSYFKQF